MSPYIPHVDGSDTSEAAAADFSPTRAQSLREQIFTLIKESGEKGMLDTELQERLGLSGSTERPRRIELVQQGRVIDSNRRRLTASSRWAVIWVAVP